MKLKVLIAILGAVQLTTGCVMVRQPPPSPGDVTFTWSFAGGGCAENPNIKSVIVTIPGETLANDGVFPCSANNYPGIVLHDFAGGRYDYTLEAVDYSNRTVFGGSGVFTVNGNVRVSLDLTPAGSPSSYAYLTWRFPPNSAANNPTCAQAGVAFVDITIDGDTARFNCSEGFKQPGVQTPYLQPGSHSITFVGLSADSYPYYRYNGTLVTRAGDPVSAEYNLAWGVGGAAFKWQLTNGSTGQTCGSSGVTTMSINFKDASGNWVYGGTGDAQDCTAAPIVYSYLQPGTYAVFIEGRGAGGILYRSNGDYPPMVTVQAGQFVGPESAMTVTLLRQ